MENVTVALQKMKANGFKNTPKRQAMLEVISKEHRFVSARQIQDVLKQTYPRLSYDTVYRNLYTFVEQGILEMSERQGEKVFLMHCQIHKHHHHFICQICQGITNIDMCPMDSFQEQLPGYHILGHRFEIVGICANCLKLDEQVAQIEQKNCPCGHH